MNTFDQSKHISIDTLCESYQVEDSFFYQLTDYGLLELQHIENKVCISFNDLNLIDKVMRLHHELNINLEGIDVIMNLLGQVQLLQSELNKVSNRLSLFE